MSSSTFSSNNLLQLQIVDRLGNLPIIHSVLGVANQSYNMLKSSNKLVTATLDQAEKSLNLLSESALTPVLNRFEQKIKYADNMACTGLDKLQQTVPVITQSPDQIKTSTQKYYDQTKDLLVNAKQQTMDKVHTVLNLSDSMVKSLETTINAAESVLDYLLPRQGTEIEDSKLNEPSTLSSSTETSNQSKSALLKMITRMTGLSDKIRRRVVDYTRYKWLPAIFGTVLFKKSSSVLSQTQTILQNGKSQLTNGTSKPKTNNNSKKAKSTEMQQIQTNGEQQQQQ